ncbi:MAG: AraC family transcriptional regulator, partial [Bacteroidota bacterium]
PFLTADAEAWRFYEPVLEQRLSELNGAALQERVRAALIEMLPSGRGSVEHVAEALAMSARSLQRHLRRENTTFQKTLAATRAQLAKHYLRSPEVTSTEVALLLGYDDPNSFFRAFRAWTGTTPERARLALA